MNDGEAIKWLEECALYFTHRSTNGEDKAHWSNVYNAENALKVAGLLRADLAPTTAQIMAHPKVQALVEALGDCREELEQAQLSQIAAKHFALAELARIACDNARAALAALEDKP